MPQFTVNSLARVLTQVEREVLVAAVEKAELTSLFMTAQLETINELQGFFNLIANVNTFGFDALEKLLEDAAEDLGPITLSLGKFAIEQFVKLADIGDVQPKHQEKLDELISLGNQVLDFAEEQTEPEIVIPPGIRTALDLLILASNNLRFAISEIGGDQAALGGAITDARNQIDAAFVLLSEFDPGAAPPPFSIER